MKDVKIGAALSFNKQIIVLQRRLDYKSQNLITTLIENAVREAYVKGRDSMRSKRKLDLDTEALDIEPLRNWLNLFTKCLPYT